MRLGGLLLQQLGSTVLGVAFGWAGLRLSWDECASFLGMLQVLCFAGAYVGLWWLAEEE